jgi:hypothetical protein
MIANNDEHTLPQAKACVKCTDEMKLNLKEDTTGNVTYVYKCTFKNCDNLEIVIHSN